MKDVTENNREQEGRRLGKRGEARVPVERCSRHLWEGAT